MEEVVRSLAQLSLSSEPKKELQHLKITLTALGGARDVLLPREIDLKSLFDAFNTSDQEQLELAVQVMGQLLPRLSPVEAVERFRGELLRGLQHPDEDVRRLVLKQVLRLVEADSDAGINIFTSDVEMHQTVLRCVGDKSLGVVKIASSVIVRACRHQAGLGAIFSPSSLSVLQEMVAIMESTMRFNVYELVVEVSLLGPAALNAAVSSGLVDRLLSEVTTGDGLTQLTALQLLTPLALSPGGRALLDEKGVTSKLMYLLSLAQSDPIARLLTHGLLEFLGNIGQARPRQTLEEHGAVTLMVLQLASGHLDLGGDPSLQASALRALAHIGTTVEGKMVLAKCKHEMDQVLETLGTEAVQGPSNLKVVCIEVLTQLFHLEPQELKEDIVSVLELWWANTLGVSEVVKLARMPFPDLHCAALGLLTTLATLPWGQRLIVGEPGLVEYILDRTTESDKQGMEAKWTLVEAIIKSPSALETFSEDQLSRLEKYFRQGPFYAEATVEVALGEGQE
ncbi:26S proteasome non-ATPase regulatory subunit 5-like [Eriocheir sinensis]|uniref:26S proteasome non-ATPase regulatory subunit 5-like n=1 Tax=Eriocheir sinensis TaxID=95602 RepID=UPI0021C5970B|nr:26S proteasome non-ATPase regulatory subunit 5-like [Eriocheir sinensis]